jgi:hypothetical protein
MIVRATFDFHAALGRASPGCQSGIDSLYQRAVEWLDCLVEGKDYKWAEAGAGRFRRLTGHIHFSRREDLMAFRIATGL